MGTLFVDTGGSANNSGSTDQNAANLTGTAATAAAAVISLDGSPDLSGLITSGANQSSIWLSQATNSNRKIFWITAFDNSLKTVTVDVAPTGITSSAWSIGGRQLYTPASIQGALRAGDTMQFNNTPAALTGNFVTSVQAGDSTNGFVRVIGKAGVRPVLECNSGNPIINGANIAGWWYENLEIRATGTSQATSLTGNTWVFYNVKFTHPSGGGTSQGVVQPAGGSKIIGCEFSGWIGDALRISNNGILVAGCYFHDCSANGLLHDAAGPFVAILNNVFDTLGGRGVLISGASTVSTHGCLVWGNTFYNCTVAGLEVSDVDTTVALINNVFQNDGTHANVIWASPSAEVVNFHAFNVFYASGGTNLTNLTANATESVANPLFINPASGDFSIADASPAAASGTPGVLLGAAANGFRDRGAVQRNAAARGAVIGG